MSPIQTGAFKSYVLYTYPIGRTFQRKFVQMAFTDNTNHIINLLLLVKRPIVEANELVSPFIMSNPMPQYIRRLKNCRCQAEPEDTVHILKAPIIKDFAFNISKDWHLNYSDAMVAKSTVNINSSISLMPSHKAITQIIKRSFLLRPFLICIWKAFAHSNDVDGSQMVPLNAYRAHDHRRAFVLLNDAREAYVLRIKHRSLLDQ